MIDHGVSRARTAAIANIARAIHSHPRQALPGGALELSEAQGQPSVHAAVYQDA
jgi:hypothetical protein